MSDTDNIVKGLESAANFDLDVDVKSVVTTQEKNKILKISLIALVAFCIVVGALLKTGVLDLQSFFEAKNNLEHDRTSFLEMGEIIVNLDTRGKGSSLLKLSVVLELKSPNDVHRAKELLPRVNDSLIFYLRGLRPSDLNGSAALYRLREELMLRFNKILSPLEIVDVLFKDIIVQ
ncbi:Flagellar FliL protein [Candidatus Cyrtobacter comes]|uniref:Flagellar protein FliL n=1 Tax=Candidatus Cyrtobacter comes TaxID=675776 RepID=A0ABU5L8C5_9RICK|nr:flagellar basal body-associated FliL family protein [Candidatus Cyrtobacter comes]MDZ5762372.1 Flagellar FliL protein [Candidatus Cyrtobacter comes]